MQSLTNSDSCFNEQLLYKLWLRKLPNQLQINLTTSETLSIDKKIALADKLYELCNKVHISEVSSNSKISSIENSIHDLANLTTSLCQNLSQLTLEVSALKFNKNNQNSKTNLKTKNFNNQNQQTICWYHSKFGDNAHKCIPPCNFTKKNTLN